MTISKAKIEELGTNLLDAIRDASSGVSAQGQAGKVLAEQVKTCVEKVGGTNGLELVRIEYAAFVAEYVAANGECPKAGDDRKGFDAYRNPISNPMRTANVAIAELFDADKLELVNEDGKPNTTGKILKLGSKGGVYSVKLENKGEATVKSDLKKAIDAIAKLKSGTKRTQSNCDELLAAVLAAGFKPSQLANFTSA